MVDIMEEDDPFSDCKTVNDFTKFEIRTCDFYTKKENNGNPYYTSVKFSPINISPEDSFLLEINPDLSYKLYINIPAVNDIFEGVTLDYLDEGNLFYWESEPYFQYSYYKDVRYSFESYDESKSDEIQQPEFCSTSFLLYRKSINSRDSINILFRGLIE
jgi:hypothetical protein